MVETLVLRVRDPKDLMEVAIEDSASAVTSASAMLSADTPAARVKLERFGKSSVCSPLPAAEGRRRRIKAPMKRFSAVHRRS